MSHCLSLFFVRLSFYLPLCIQLSVYLFIYLFASICLFVWVPSSVCLALTHTVDILVSRDLLKKLATFRTFFVSRIKTASTIHSASLFLIEWTERRLSSLFPFSFHLFILSFLYVNKGTSSESLNKPNPVHRPFPSSPLKLYFLYTTLGEKTRPLSVLV